MEDIVFPSTCSECLVRCGSLIHVKDGKVVKIAGNPAHPSSQGVFCVKGMNAPIVARDHPMRVTHPMRRAGPRGGGKWERISWDAALAGIADQLGEIKRAYGGKSIVGAVSTHTQSRGVAMRQLLRSLGSPNLMINQDMCHGCRATAALLTGLGGLGADAGSELTKSRVIMVIGKSPSESHIAEWAHIKAAQSNGAKLIVVDPRRTQIARSADHWLAVKPGTDAALALSMAHVLFKEALIDQEFVADWCMGTEELRLRSEQYPPERAAEITGIAAGDIFETARIFATTKPASIVLGHGVDSQINGVNTAISFQSLLALTGNIDREGTNRLGKKLSGFRDNFIHAPELSLPRAIEEQTIGAYEYPLWSGPDSWAKACHNPSVLRAVQTGDPYPVRAMYISGTNILCTYPDHSTTVAALHALDLLVVASDQMTPTAELADFFLPKTTLLEEEDVVMENGGPCISLTRRVLPPQPEARTDVEIAAGLRDALAERGLIDFDLMPWNTHDEFNEYLLRDTSITLDVLREKGFYQIPYSYETYRTSGFKTPSRKFEFNSSRLVNGSANVIPDYFPPPYAVRSEGFDLILLTGIRTMGYQNSRFRDHAWARRLQSDPQLCIHPATAARHGIGKNDWIWVQTDPTLPRCLLKAHFTEELAEDTVTTGMGWWYPEIRGADHGAKTFNIGVAVRYGPEYDRVSGSAETRNVACCIERADPADVKVLLREVNNTRDVR